MARYIGNDFIGTMFNRLRVVSVKRERGKKTQFLCICKCGVLKTLRAIRVINGETRSCGCIAREGVIKRNFKHGHSKRGRMTREYKTWNSMIERCSDKNNQNYGGRGISVCKRWMVFENFYADMGKRPTGLTIERIENNKGYSKKNCKWATRQEQVINQRKRKNKTSKHIGVFWCKVNKKWYSSVFRNGKNVCKKSFSTEKEAHFYRVEFLKSIR